MPGCLTRHGVLALGASIAVLVLSGCGPSHEAAAPMPATPSVPPRLATPSTPTQERPAPAQDSPSTLSTATTTPAPATPSPPLPTATATPPPATSPLPLARRQATRSVPSGHAWPAATGRGDRRQALSAPTITRTPTPTATAAPWPVPTMVAPTATLLPSATVNPAHAPAEAAGALPFIHVPRATLAHHSSSYEVGAYYFSGWSHGPNDNLNPLLMGRYQTSEPLIGWYDDTQTAVDQSITQAAGAGIDFFAFDWYDIARSPYPTDRSLNEGLAFYLSSTQRYRLKFCLLFADHAPFLPRASDWPALIATWIGYFKQPDYVQVAGRPLFIVFNPDNLRQVFGSSAGVRAALDLLRARARAAGLPGVTVAAAAAIAPHANPIHAQQLTADGYDVTTGYDYRGLGGERYNVPAPYRALVDENVAMWDRVATQIHLPYIPVITSGFDLRYSIRDQQHALIYAGRTPRQFACYAALARHWIDTHPAQTMHERVVLVYAWTEIGEGGAIIPSRGDGYAYAYALRTVFGTPDALPATPPYC